MEDINIDETIGHAHQLLSTDEESSYIRLVHRAWKELIRRLEPDETLSEVSERFDDILGPPATIQDAGYISFEVALQYPKEREEAVSLYNSFLATLSSDSAELRSRIRIYKACVLFTDEKAEEAWPILQDVFDSSIEDDSPKVKQFVRSIENKRSDEYYYLVDSLGVVSHITDFLDFDKEDFFVY